MLSAVPQWVALYTNPRMEKKAEKNLAEAGYEVYLSIRRELDIPVKFVGVGEGIDDMKPFDADEFAEALFGGSIEE